LFIRWNTDDLAEGNYTLSAFASVVQDEENIENNSYVDDVVEIVSAPKHWFIPLGFYYFLLLILFLILTILIILLIYRRKRKKNVQKAFHSGIFKQKLQNFNTNKNTATL